MPKDESSDSAVAVGVTRTHEVQPQVAAKRERTVATGLLSAVAWRAFKGAFFSFDRATKYLKFVPLVCSLIVTTSWLADALRFDPTRIHANDVVVWIWHTIAENAGWIAGAFYVISFLKEVWSEFRRQEAEARARNHRHGGEIETRNVRITALEESIRRDAMLLSSKGHFELVPGSQVRDPSDARRFLIKNYLLQLDQFELINQWGRPATISVALVAVSGSGECVEIPLGKGCQLHLGKFVFRDSVIMEPDDISTGLLRWIVSTEEATRIREIGLHNLRVRVTNRMNPKQQPELLRPPGDCRLPV